MTQYTISRIIRHGRGEEAKIRKKGKASNGLPKQYRKDIQTNELETRYRVGVGGERESLKKKDLKRSGEGRKIQGGKKLTNPSRVDMALR